MSGEIRLIDANALKYAVMDSFTKSTSMINIVGQIERAPTIEAEPVRNGAVRITRQSGFICMGVCSICERGPILDAYMYCPYCGAKMEVEAHDKPREEAIT